MRYRELPGWASCLVAARKTWPRIPEETWNAVGELDAGARTYLGTQNVIYVAACTAGLVAFPKRRR